MLSRTIAEKTIRKALSTGGDFAEIFYEDTENETYSLMDSAIQNAVSVRAHGAGIRVYCGLNSVYVFTNDTSEAGLVRAASRAADALPGDAGMGKDIRLIRSTPANLHAIRSLTLDVEPAKRAALLRNADKAARAVSAEIRQVSAMLKAKHQSVTIANSEGLFISDKRVYTRLGINAVASSGTESQTAFAGPGGLVGWEFFDTFDVEQRAAETAERAVKMLHAGKCPSGVMPVVIDGGFGGVIFHEACGHSLEATSVAFGNSEFCGKLGQKIASDKVSAFDDGTIANAWGSSNIDDEGNPTACLQLIDHGILKNYMIDRLNSRRMNMPVTGSGRREDYTYAPTSRMRNTYIAAGNDDEAEIIASCPDGLYARTMGGGSVNPLTGEFNFAVEEGYLIRNGQIDQPVRGALLIGKGAEMLPRIDRVGKKMWMAQGMCGSSSGSVPTNVGQPMIRVTEITVGGH